MRQCFRAHSQEAFSILWFFHNNFVCGFSCEISCISLPTFQPPRCRFVCLFVLGVKRVRTLSNPLLSASSSSLQNKKTCFKTYGKRKKSAGKQRGMPAKWRLHMHIFQLYKTSTYFYIDYFGLMVSQCIMYNEKYFILWTYRVFIKYCVFFKEFSIFGDLSFGSTGLLFVVQKMISQ